MSGDSIIDLLAQGRDREAQASKIYGFVVGIVTNNVDPKKLGRIKVRFPWLAEDVESWWARIVYPMGGKQRGYWWIPEIDDEVLVGFEHGDVRFPYIVGSLYNGKDIPPVCHDVTNSFGEPRGYDHGPYPTKGRDWNQDGADDLRFIRSRSGHLFIMDDKRGSEKVTLCNNTGGQRIEIFTDKKKIVVTSDDGDIELIAKETILMRCKNLVTESWEDHSFHAYRDYKVLADRDSTHEAGRNVSRTAGKNMDDKAGQQRTAKSGANTIIKGAKVFIN